MVYVLDRSGRPLMPTKRHGNVRRMLDAGKAKVVRRTPFTIQLQYASTSYTQDVTLGVDAGYAHVGACATTEKEVLFSGQLELRTDIVDLLAERRQLRHARRNRKTRYRKPRFDNRVHGKKKGWRAPSVVQKVDSHIQLIRKVCRILPVTKLRVETAEFDIHKIKNPEVSGTGYQHGEKYGHYNTRNYVLWRDGHRCRCCGKSGGYLYVVSADGRDTEAPEDLYTVCKECLQAHLNGEKPFMFRKKRHFAPPTEMGIMRDLLLQKCRDAFPFPVDQTYGYVTKGIRKDLGICKTHENDAYCIAGNLEAKPAEESFLLKKVRCHNRKLHKMSIGRGGIRKNHQAPYTVNGFRLFDKVRFQRVAYFIYGRRVRGYFSLRSLDGSNSVKDVSCKKLEFLEPRKRYLIERRIAGA